MQGEKSKLIIWGIILFVVIVIIIISILLGNREIENEFDTLHDNLTNEYYYSEVYDYNLYQSVYQVIFNYYIALNNRDNYQLSLLLLDEYKNRYYITSDNLNDYIEEYYGQFIYRITDIQCYKNSYFSIYYVEGSYAQELLDSQQNEIVVKDLVFFDLTKGTYAILPILDVNLTFEDVVLEYNLAQYNTLISDNNFNLIQNVSVSDFQKASSYFGEFLNLLYTDCSAAYSLVGENTKDIYSSMEEFQSVCNLYTSQYQSVTIEDYQVSNVSGYTVIIVEDNYNVRYQFQIQSVKDYSVDMDLN